MIRILLLSLLFAAAAFTQAATTRTDLHVRFAKDQSTLDAIAIAQLDSFLTELTIEGDYAFTVHGHTDDDGSYAYNEALAAARASTVQRYLVDHGADAASITVDRSGERDPLATNTTDDGQAVNRRVRITFTRHVFANTEELRHALQEGSVQHFTIDPTQEQTVRGTAGVHVRFPVGCFIDEHGGTVRTPVTVELTEALGLDAMLAHQLSTRSGDRLLETGGMLRVQASTTDGRPIALRADSPMEVRVPRTAQLPDMELFTSSDGGDWTAVGQLLSAFDSTTTVTVQRPYPMPPRLPFRWPVYREDQAGKPMKPSEPVLKDPPDAPRYESYVRQPAWWSIVGRESARARGERRYQAAVERHTQKLRKHKRTSQLFELACDGYPAKLEAYSERKARWDELKRAERAHWDSTVYQAAQRQYREIYGAELATADSLVKAWHAERTADMQRIGDRMDSLGLAEVGSLGNYVFNTSSTAWINCDRFNDVPAFAKRTVRIPATEDGDEHVFVVFTRLRSVLNTTRTERQHLAEHVPGDEPKVLFAYTVKDGRAQVCVQQLDRSVEPKLTFRPSTYNEIRSLLQELSGGGA